MVSISSLRILEKKIFFPTFVAGFMQLKIYIKYRNPTTASAFYL